MEFLSGKDMNAQMTVQTKGNLKTTFYISKLHIKGTVSILSSLAFISAVVTLFVNATIAPRILRL